MLLDIESGLVNIKDLSFVAPPKPERLPFDPDLDITEEDWQRVGQKLYMVEDRSRVTRPLEAIKILSPTRYEQIAGSLKFSQSQLWSQLRDAIRESGKSRPDFLENCRQAKTLFPQRFEEFSRRNFLRDRVKYFRKYFNRPRGSLTPYVPYYLRMLVDVKLVFPDIQINPRTLDNMTGLGIKTVKQQQQEEQWYLLSETFADLKLLDSSSFLSVSVADRDWIGMRKALDIQRKNSSIWSESFPEVALNLSIIAAHSARITPNGIEIIMDGPNPPVTLIDNLEMPIRRAF